MEIGEGFAGNGADAAHVNTVYGLRDGPVGTSWATALATPSAGHVPFVCVLQPGLAVQPLTLFVNKAAVEGGRHAELTWGAAQAGVAGGVADALAEGVLLSTDATRSVVIAAVWVDPAAADAEAVYRNNRDATLVALRNGSASKPSVADVVAARERPWNPFYDSGT